jgi:hypothetical protein
MDRQENTPAVTRTRISCLGNGRFILLNYRGIDLITNLVINRLSNTIHVIFEV